MHDQHFEETHDGAPILFLARLIGGKTTGNWDSRSMRERADTDIGWERDQQQRREQRRVAGAEKQNRTAMDAVARNGNLMVATLLANESLISVRPARLARRSVLRSANGSRTTPVASPRAAQR